MTLECLIMIFLGVIVIGFCYRLNNVKHGTKFQKEGPYIVYYSKTFKTWRYVKVWSSLVKPRFFHVHDTIAGKEYDHWYNGEGLENILWTQENLDSLKGQNVDKEQIRLIDKEDEYLKMVVSDEQRGDEKSGRYSL